MNLKKASDRIIELKERDLQLRAQLLDRGVLYEGYNVEMEQLHNQHAAELQSIIDVIGYPTIEKVGQEGSEAAWLIIQHSIAQPQFMRECATLLEAVVKNHKEYAVQLAYLTDRIAVFEGQPQKYGTQFDWDANGEMSPQLYDDREKVNKRRQSIGLCSLEEQIIIMREQIQAEQHKPPPDFIKRNQKFDNWRRCVGWIHD